MKRVIAIVNQKGGVGKTTTAAALAEGLQLRGFSVLSVDLDPQGNLSYIMRADTDDAPTIRDVLRGSVTAAEAIQSTPAGDILPADIDLSGVDMEISQKLGREFILRRALEKLPADKYDYIVIDCPPSLGIFTINALTAADRLLIPMAADGLSIKGMTQLLDTAGQIRDNYNTALEFEGIIITKFDGRANVRKDLKDTIESIADQLGCRSYGPIREAAAVVEAQARKTGLQEHAAGSKVAEDYNAFIEQFLAADPEAQAKSTAPEPAAQEG